MKKVLSKILICSLIIFCLVGCKKEHKEEKKEESKKIEIKDTIRVLNCNKKYNENDIPKSFINEETNKPYGTLIEYITVSYKNEKMTDYKTRTELALADEKTTEEQKQNIETIMNTNCLAENNNCISYISNIKENIITSNISYKLDSLSSLSNNNITKQTTQKELQKYLEKNNYTCILTK